jgi:hypothetical protein
VLSHFLTFRYSFGHKGKTPPQVVSAYMQAYPKTNRAKSGINTKEKQVRAHLLEKVALSIDEHEKTGKNSEILLIHQLHSLWMLFLLFFCMIVLQK